MVSILGGFIVSASANHNSASSKKCPQGVIDYVIGELDKLYNHLKKQTTYFSSVCKRKLHYHKIQVKNYFCWKQPRFLSLSYFFSFRFSFSFRFLSRATFWIWEVGFPPHASGPPSPFCKEKYCVSKKELPLLYSKLLYKMGHYFLAI